MSHQVKTIDVHELKKRHEQNPYLHLIDVREDFEWQEQHIPWAVHVPKDQLVKEITKLIPDLQTPVYLHCRGGTRSLHSGLALMDLGYKEVYSIDGGIMDWEKSGYTVSTAQ